MAGVAVRRVARASIQLEADGDDPRANWRWMAATSNLVLTKSRGLEYKPAIRPPLRIFKERLGLLDFSERVLDWRPSLLVQSK
ncbi:hypothetical protein OROMI_033950 [Orobanche minor]